MLTRSPLHDAADGYSPLTVATADAPGAGRALGNYDNRLHSTTSVTARRAATASSPT